MRTSKILSAVGLLGLSLILSGCYDLKVDSTTASQQAPGSAHVTINATYCAIPIRTDEEPVVPVLDVQADENTNLVIDEPPVSQTPDCQEFAGDLTDETAFSGDSQGRFVIGLSIPTGATAPDEFDTTDGRVLHFVKNTSYADFLEDNKHIDGQQWVGYATDTQLTDSPSPDHFSVQLPITVLSDSDGQPIADILHWRTGAVVTTPGDATGDTTSGCIENEALGAARSEAIQLEPTAPGRVTTFCVSPDYDTDHTLALAKIADQCPNQTGLQQTVPTGQHKDQEGNCVVDPTQPAAPTTPTSPVSTILEPTVDLCSNIAEVQTQVPAGLHIKDGRCVPIGRCTITGTSHNDHLVGTNGNDIICGLGGADTISGRGGNDEIIGGSGADTLSGGPGIDMIVGGAGNDRLDGGTGTDTILGDSGADMILGRSGDDNLYGGPGNDHVSGGPGNDHLVGSSGNDVLSGDQGNDMIAGNSGNDHIAGGAGADQWLNGGTGSDLIHGNGSNDVIYGGAGSDSLYGDAGNDIFYRSPGCDKWHGGAGDDKEIIFIPLAGIGCSGIIGGV